MERRVLIGTAGTGTSWGTLMSLREAFPGTFVVAADMAPAREIAASSLADAFERMPPIGSGATFVDALLRILQSHRVDTYLPSHDPEVIVAAQLRERGELGGIACPAPPSESGLLCWDKQALAKWLTKRGFPTPPVTDVDAIDDPADGWLVKPRAGVGSVGVLRVMSAHDLDQAKVLADETEVIAQPLLHGPEITVDAFLGSKAAAAICRERVEVKSGVSTKARLFRDTAMEQLVLEVGRALELRGAFCVQLMADESGQRQITDVNPRPGAGTRLSAAIGFNVHAAMLADLWGLDPTPHLQSVDSERWVVRQYREIVLV